MTSWRFKFTFLLATIFAISYVTQADTKALGTIRIYVAPFSSRDETISLENDNDLVIKGMYEDKFIIPDNLAEHLKSTIVYVADKNGYRAKYILIKVPAVFSLSPSSLKSLTG